jgi:tungstate transport system permease protein
MGLPPVLVGLVVYLMVARTGPLGSLEILFTPIAMVFAQVILTLPIIIGLTRSSIKAFSSDFSDTVYAMGASKSQHFFLTIEESRYDITIAIILAFGRAISEVGAILIVGGNIRFHTRVLTTAIITEVSKGQNEFALALGVILLTISYSITFVMTGIQFRSNRYE